jgi:hypothetical protein
MLNGSRPRSATISINSTNNNNKPKGTVNPQRREKLKSLLIDKYCKKYGRDCTEDLIKYEVNVFLDKETLTEKELKELDRKIEYLVKNKDSVNKLKRNLTCSNAPDLEIGDREENYNDNDDMSVSNYKYDNKSVMSYSTRNSKARDIGYQDDNLSFYSKEKPVERIEFSEKGEWEAIAQFNKDSFKENLLLNKVKDKQKKFKTKEELTDQMIIRQNVKTNEKRQDLEYGIVVNQHVDYLTNIEKLKQMKEKEKMMTEKRIRDEQLVDNKKKKKTELKSQRDYDLKLLKKIKDENEEETKRNIQRKEEKHEELQATLRENEAHKKVLNLRALLEREEDIKSQNEYARILDKQQRDREEYFKSKERQGNTLSKFMVENVIKAEESKNKKLLDTIDKYQQQKDKR